MTQHTQIDDAVKRIDTILPCNEEGCDGYGTIPRQIDTNTWEPEQCEFCYTYRIPLQNLFRTELAAMEKRVREEDKNNFIHILCNTPYTTQTDNSTSGFIERVIQSLTKEQEKG